MPRNINFFYLIFTYTVQKPAYIKGIKGSIFLFQFEPKHVEVLLCMQKVALLNVHFHFMIL